MKDKTVKCEITEHIATLPAVNGYSVEINMVSWDGHKPVLDIRRWYELNGEKYPRMGLSLSEDEARTLYGALKDITA